MSNEIRVQSNDGTQRREKTVTTNVSPEDFKVELFKNNLHRVKGKLQIKEGDYDPVTLALLNTELRRRDTEGFATRLSLDNTQLKKELEYLKNKVSTEFVPKEQVVVDEELKYTDVDEYIRQKMAVEANQNPHQTVYNEAHNVSTAEAKQQQIDNAVARHNEANPDRVLTPQILAMDIPVPEELTKSLAEGNISLEEYLDVVSADVYNLNKGNTNQENPQYIEEPNLSNVGGSGSDFNYKAEAPAYGTSIF